MKKSHTRCDLHTNPHLMKLAIFVAAAALSGCGGGGGGSGDTSSVNPAAPTATPSAVSTLEDVPASGTLTASDPDGDPLTYSIASPPGMGSAVITDAASGTFTYTPDPDKNGTDIFTFVASDGASDSNSADVTITITADADAPIAQPGDLTTDEDTPANGTLTAGDPDGDPLTYSIASQPSMGSAVINDVASGTFTYTPDPDQNGPDSFTFSASDGSTDSNIETVTVTINPVNDAPLAVGSCNTTPQAQTLTGKTLSATDPDSSFLTYSLPNGSTDTSLTTAKGVVTITNPTTGDFTYTPLTNGDRGRDTFSYQVIDNDGGISNATETVIVDQTIMPLGDSITMGSVFNGVDFGTDASRVGYRKPLFNGLATSAYTFDFVGSLSHGGAVLRDPEHEGHGGWTANQIAWGLTNPGTDGDGEGVFDWLEDSPADIILLHAGTNGLDPNGDIDVEVILDEIDRWENSANGNPVTVILARIIDQDPINPDVTTFNDNVESMADARINDDIIIVNQQNALIYPADMSDDKHPNDNGYAKMANVWLDALTDVNPNTNEAVLDKCP